MSLLAKSNEVKEKIKTTLSKVPLSSKIVYGKNASVMIGIRPPGYHSKPHRHDCEQINYVASGEMDLFIENKRYHQEKGDFSRIPANRIHWAWNKGNETCVLFEVHIPGLHADWKDVAFPLLDADEEDDGKSVRNIMIDLPASFMETVESEKEQ